MLELSLVLSVFLIVLFCIFLVVKFAERFGASEQELDALERQVERVSKINEVLSRPRKRGKDLLDSLRKRSSRGMPNE